MQVLEKLLLTTREVADVTNMSVRSVWRKAADPDDDFPEPIRDGGLTRWRTRDVINWVERR